MDDATKFTNIALQTFAAIVELIIVIHLKTAYLLAALFIDYLVSFIAMRNKISKNYVYASYI